MNKYSVGIVGFRGYSGAELVQILKHHPGVEVFLMEHRADAADRPRARGQAGPPRIACTPEDVKAKGLAAIFLATPPEVSMDLTPGFIQAGAKVIDLSGAYRLRTRENYARWYKADHAQPDLLAEAVYGLPEFYRDKIVGARLVSNPGCYPTAANLAIRPMVEAGLLDLNSGVVCDAKSGISGAGRKPSLKTSYCEAAENFSAYSLLNHRHVPEVLQNSGLDEAGFSFVAHLIPCDRGILETIYFRTKGVKSGDDLISAYEARYGSEPFVHIHDHGNMPDLRSVQRTNFCEIGVHYDPGTGRAVVVSAIDNLVKGAAGQAIQNMNLVLGFEETEALL